MQYMNDPTLRVMTKEQRGMDVNDITGKKKSMMSGPGSLPPTGPIQRATSVRPRQQEYDIINPSGMYGDSASNANLRMSGYGKNVLGSQNGSRSSHSVAAGNKIPPKDGEASMNQIWPSDESQRGAFNDRTRNMDTSDINQPRYNPRMQKLKQADAARAQQAMQEQQPPSMRQDKNASVVFNHLVDDPSTRAKLAAAQQQQQLQQQQQQQYQQQHMQAPPMQAYGNEQDMLDRMMYQEQQQKAQQMNGGGGLPPSGKRQVQRDHTTVATGMMRLFGGDRGDQNAPDQAMARPGKRMIGLPSQQAGLVNVFN